MGPGTPGVFPGWTPSGGGESSDSPGRAVVAVAAATGGSWLLVISRPGGVGISKSSRVASCLLLFRLRTSVGSRRRALLSGGAPPF